MSADIIDEIREERVRQVAQEGWTAQHDDRHHHKGELSNAGSCYAMHASYEIHPSAVGFWSPPPAGWPFEEEWWKPKDPRRDLIRAAALIVAEIERLDRTDAWPARDKENQENG